MKLYSLIIYIYDNISNQTNFLDNIMIFKNNFGHEGPKTNKQTNKIAIGLILVIFISPEMTSSGTQNC